MARRRDIPPEVAVALIARRRQAVAVKRERKQLRQLGWALKRVRERELAALLEEHEALGAYETRGAAEASGGGFAAGLAVGLSVVAVVGLGFVLYYLLVRRREPLAGPMFIERHAVPEPMRLSSGRARGDDRAAKLDRIYDRSQVAPARMRSLSLPQMGTSAMAIRVATAGGAPTDVVLRVVGPPGGFGVFSTDAAELNIPGIGATPVGETLLLATGESQTIRLEPRQALYARGNTAGVIASVTTSEAVVRTIS